MNESLGLEQTWTGFETAVGQVLVVVDPLLLLEVLAFALQHWWSVQFVLQESDSVELLCLWVYEPTGSDSSLHVHHVMTLSSLVYK